MHNELLGLKRFFPIDHNLFFSMVFLVNSSNANVGSDRVTICPHSCFGIAADLLQTVVNDMLSRGVLTLPIPSHDPDFPIIQYADGTIIILSVAED